MRIVAGSIHDAMEKPVAAFLFWRNHNKFLFHLIALIILIILLPYFEQNFIDETFINILLAIVLISGVYAVSDTIRKLGIALVLGVPSIILGWMYLSNKVILYEFIASVFSLLFFAFVTITILLSILREKNVCRDTLFGSICVYILLGITWAVGYMVLEMAIPNSFAVAGLPGAGHLNTFSDYILYSFSNLTLLGSNGGLAVSSTAITMVTFEAICGTIYIAVLIAWLIGAYPHSPGKQG